MTPENTLIDDLLDAALTGDLAAAAAILTKHPALVNCRDDRGITPIMLAAEAWHLPIVELLLSHGADLDLVDYDGEDTLYKASRRFNNSAIMELLLQRGNPVDRASKIGRTALIEGGLPWV